MLLAPSPMSLWRPPVLMRLCMVSSEAAEDLATVCRRPRQHGALSSSLPIGDRAFADAFRAPRMFLLVPTLDGVMMMLSFVHHGALERIAPAAGPRLLHYSYGNRALWGRAGGGWVYYLCSLPGLHHSAGITPDRTTRQRQGALPRDGMCDGWLSGRSMA